MFLILLKFAQHIINKTSLSHSFMIISCNTFLPSHRVQFPTVAVCASHKHGKCSFNNRTWNCTGVGQVQLPGVTSQWHLDHASRSELPVDFGSMKRFDAAKYSFAVHASHKDGSGRHVKLTPIYVDHLSRHCVYLNLNGSASFSRIIDNTLSLRLASTIDVN